MLIMLQNRKLNLDICNEICPLSELKKQFSDILYYGQLWDRYLEYRISRTYKIYVNGKLDNFIFFCRYVTLAILIKFSQ